MVLFWPALGRSARTRSALPVQRGLTGVLGLIRAYAEGTRWKVAGRMAAGVDPRVRGGHPC